MHYLLFPFTYNCLFPNKLLSYWYMRMRFRQWQKKVFRTIEEEEKSLLDLFFFMNSVKRRR
jgi:hypothetical protein